MTKVTATYTDISNFIQEKMSERHTTFPMLAAMLGVKSRQQVQMTVKSKWTAVYRLAKLLSLLDYELVMQPKTAGPRKTGSKVICPDGLIEEE